MATVISNPQTGELPRVKGPEMNDRDMINDVLATEKYLTQVFTIVQQEASHTKLSNDINVITNQTHMCQRDLYNMMFKKGWYKLDAADRQQVSQTQEQFSNYHSSQLPYAENIHY